MKHKIKTTFEELPKTYHHLANNVLMPRPIHDKAGLENAVEVVNIMAGHKLNKDQEEYIDAVSTFIEHYEKELNLFEKSKVSGIDALKFLIEENEMNAVDLSLLLGCEKSLGSKILNGERNLTKDHIRVLAKRFKIRADVFLD